MLKLNVGFSRKVGERNYGSRGASVHLEHEAESNLVHDPTQLHERIRFLFRLARQAVEEELNAAHDDHRPSASAVGGDCGNENGRGAERPATQSQLRALRSIARRQRIDLAAEARLRFGVDELGDLLVSEASQLIDALKPATNGHGG